MARFGHGNLAILLHIRTGSRRIVAHLRAWLHIEDYEGLRKKKTYLAHGSPLCAGFCHLSLGYAALCPPIPKQTHVVSPQHTKSVHSKQCLHLLQHATLKETAHHVVDDIKNMACKHAVCKTKHTIAFQHSFRRASGTGQQVPCKPVLFVLALYSRID
eukprot:1014328-Amphidinium_carterae.2